MAADDRMPELRFLKRLTLYKPNGQNITRLITSEGYQDGMLSFVDSETKRSVKTTLPFTLELVPEDSAEPSPFQ